MERTGIVLMKEMDYFGVGMQQNSAFLLWQSADKNAAEVRLRMLHKMKNQPAQIDREFQNIRTSVNFLKKQCEHGAADIFFTYIEVLESYLHLRGRNSELEDWCSTGLSICEKLRRNPSRILLILGNAQYALGQWEQAGMSWQACADASREVDQFIYAYTILALGRLQVNQGKYKTAIETLAYAEKLLEKINEIQGVISARSEVAAYHLDRRELEKALYLYLEIDDLYKKNNASESSNHITLMLGVIYRQKRMFDKAVGYLSELYRRGETQNDISSMATATHHLAWVYFECRELETARYLCGKALSLYEDLQDPRGLSDSYEQLGAILLEEGKLENAITLLKQSLQLRKDIGNDPGSVSSQRRLALAYILEGKYKLAIRLSIQVLIDYIQLGILSRQRILALSKDFLAGVSKAILHRITVRDGSTEHYLNNELESVTKSLAYALMQSKKKTNIPRQGTR
jgi:tetratricopeptide (TPR) repeat protein